MAKTPEPRSLLARLLGGLRSGPLGMSQGETGQWDTLNRHSQRPRRRLWRRPRRGSLGSALVQALMAGLVAVIAAFLLASRLLSSRFGSFSRSDSLSAREAAEYGLNELQAKLNTDQYAYLWVTKREKWSSVSRQDLTNCKISTLDANGEELTTLPALPAGISTPEKIGSEQDESDSNSQITYQLSGFAHPELPDKTDETARQKEFCIETTNSSTNFGNLNGGSALITVTGTVTRGSGTTAKTTSFKLSRSVHVVPPSGRQAFSFMILGDAYEDKDKADPITPAKFGSSSDIALLNRLDGNICYPSAEDRKNNKIPTSCFNPDRPKTIIGCVDVTSCLINNVENLTPKQQLKNCGVKIGKKKPKFFLCNSFQQAPPLPPIPTPISESTDVSEAQWPAFAFKLECSLKRDSKTKFDECKSTRDENKSLKVSKEEVKDQIVAFPYKFKDDKKLTLTRSDVEQMSNSDLVRGCYFSNTSPSDLSAKFNVLTRSVNCLVEDLTIKETNSSNVNLKIHTLGTDGSTLPYVNLFLWGGNKSEIKLEAGGIEGNNTQDLGWSRTKILGKPATTAAGSSVSCNASSPIKSYKKNDLNNLFIWLPNASLIFDKTKIEDNAYLVAWVCKVSGFKKSSGEKYSIITPLPEDVVRSGLTSSIGPSFIRSAGGTYRAFGSEDNS